MFVLFTNSMRTFDLEQPNLRHYIPVVSHNMAVNCVKLTEAMDAYYQQHKCIAHIHCVPKSDAKIEITIATLNLVRIKHPLSNFNYHLSGTNVANLSTAQFLSCLKNGTQKHRFPIWKIPISSVSYTHLTLPTNREV